MADWAGEIVPGLGQARRSCADSGYARTRMVPLVLYYLTLHLDSDRHTPWSAPIKLVIQDMTRPDRTSPEYTRELSTAVRWDSDRQELYLRLPSFPHLRLFMLREGIEDDLVRLRPKALP